MSYRNRGVMWDCNSPYKYRDGNLRALGFKSYRSYLASDLWQSIRARVFDRDKWLCQRCGRKMEHPQAHHRAYDPATLRGDNINAITSVCSRCHVKAEQPKKFRSGHDRLAEASHLLLKRPRKRAQRQRRRKDRPDCAPFWSRHVGQQSEP